MLKTFTPDGVKFSPPAPHFKAESVAVLDMHDLYKLVVKLSSSDYAALTLSAQTKPSLGAIRRTAEWLRPPATTNILWFDFDHDVVGDVRAWVANRIRPVLGDVGALVFHSQSSCVDGRPVRVHAVVLTAEPVAWESARVIVEKAGADASIYNAHQLIFVGPPRLHGVQCSLRPDERILQIPGPVWTANPKLLPKAPSIPKVTKIRSPKPGAVIELAKDIQSGAPGRRVLLGSIREKLLNGRPASTEVVPGKYGNSDALVTRFESGARPSVQAVRRGQWDDVLDQLSESDTAWVVANGRASYIKSIWSWTSGIINDYLVDPGAMEGKRWESLRRAGFALGTGLPYRADVSGATHLSRLALTTIARAYSIHPLYRAAFAAEVELVGPRIALERFSDRVMGDRYRHYMVCAEDSFLAGILVTMVRVRSEDPKKSNKYRSQVEDRAAKRIDDVRRAPEGQRQTLAFKAMSWLHGHVKVGNLPSIVLAAVAEAARAAWGYTKDGCAAADDLLRRFDVIGTARSCGRRLAQATLMALVPS